MERQYFDIDESLAKQANDMMSFSDYKHGSLTAEYRLYVDKAYDIADEVVHKKPEDAERIYAIANRYAKKMAENLNKRSRIGCMCPSVMICGPANFPVRKKEKQNAAADKNYQEWNNIQKLLDKMKQIQLGSSIIKAGDADAIEKLEKKLERLKRYQEVMKAVNAYYRKNKTLYGCAGMSEEEIKKIQEKMKSDWHYENKPFMTWELSNNNQNIHSVENRLKSLKSVKDSGIQELENKYFKVIENTEIMRLQLYFEEKPEETTRTILKRNGFKWAPSQGAWQRQLTDNAKYSLKKVLEILEKQK